MTANGLARDLIHVMFAASIAGLAVLTSACGGGDSADRGAAGSPVADRGAAGSPVSESPGGVFDLVPDDQRDLAQTDVQALLADQAFESVADQFLEQWESLEDLGIFVDEITSLSIARGESGTLVIIDGDFDQAGIEEELYDLYFEDDNYRDTEYWTGVANVFREQTGTLAFLGGGRVLLGWPGDEVVKDAIRTLARGAGSLGEEAGIGGIAERLPEGFWSYIEASCGGWGLRDCNAWGTAVTSQDEFTAGQTWVFAFEDERAAKFNLDEIEEGFGGLEDELQYFETSVSQDGAYVLVTAAQDTEDVALRDLSFALKRIDPTRTPIYEPETPTPSS